MNRNVPRLACSLKTRVTFRILDLIIQIFIKIRLYHFHPLYRQRRRRYSLGYSEALRAKP
jgi:hypothetical protein